MINGSVGQILAYIRLPLIKNLIEAIVNEVKTRVLSILRFIFHKTSAIRIPNLNKISQLPIINKKTTKR